MKLQVALDRVSLHRAVDLAVAVAPYVDWIEVGTSVVKQYGVDALRCVRDAVPATPVLADLKTVDDVEFELNLAYDSGASSVTVLGSASTGTLDKAVRVAAARDAELVVDLLGLTTQQTATLAQRLPRTVRLGAHVGKDTQGTGEAAAHLLGPWAHTHPVAVAGGLTAEDLPTVAGLRDVRAIVGSAVTAAADPAAAARQLKAAADKIDRRPQPTEADHANTASDPIGTAAPRTDALAHTVLEELSAALAATAGEQVQQLADALADAHRVIVTGEGRSGLMAKAFAMRLMHLGLRVHVIGETTSPALADGDTVVAVSGSGTTAATVRAAEQAQSVGATVHAVTTDAASPLAARATTVLLVPAATKHRRAHEAATIQPLSSLFDQSAHVLLDVVCLHLTHLRQVEHADARAAHSNTE